MILRHAVEKGGKIYLTVKEKGLPYKRIEWHGSITELEKMVMAGELRMTRQPTTILERRLVECPERFALVKKLRLIRSMEKRKEVTEAIEQAIDWIMGH